MSGRDKQSNWRSVEGSATTLRRRRNSLHPARAGATCAIPGGVLVKRHHRYFLTNDRELPGRLH